jgi:HemY protein
MVAALSVLLVLGLAVAAAWQLREMGGSVEIAVGELFLAIDLPALLVALALLFAVLHGLLSGLRALAGWPARRRARIAALRRAEGDAALTRALSALAAGTVTTARNEVKRARARLGDTPQLLLLAAEAERLAGREDRAAEAYAALAARDESRFLGLRGLLRQAIAREDWADAQRLAREAEAAQPDAAWVREERQRVALRMRDWPEALALSPPGQSRAPLALAAALQTDDPDQAAAFEREAFAADPGFPPAALAHARRLAGAGQSRRAKAVLEQGWAASPLPELAEEYLRGEGDLLARARAAELLVHRNATHPESRLLLARTWTAANLTGRARAELTALLGSGQADRRAYQAMIELDMLEQGEGPAGRAAEAKWLRAAAAAPPPPAWICAECGTEQPRWVPDCPSCGAIGRIAWESGTRTPAPGRVAAAPEAKG